jgi:hypothetical protein
MQAPSSLLQQREVSSGAVAPWSDGWKNPDLSKTRLILIRATSHNRLKSHFEAFYCTRARIYVNVKKTANLCLSISVPAAMNCLPERKLGERRERNGSKWTAAAHTEIVTHSKSCLNSRAPNRERDSIFSPLRNLQNECQIEHRCLLSCLSRFSVA